MPSVITGRIRFAKIIETPEQITDSYESAQDVPRWRTRVKFYQKVLGEDEPEAFFPPWHVPTERIGDRVCVVKREAWEVIVPAVHGIGRITGAVGLSPNRWKYTVTLAKFGCSVNNDTLSPSIVQLTDEIPYDALNLYEVENNETGLMGNGMDLTGYVDTGANHSSLAPAPNGTLVWVTGYCVGSSDSTGGQISGSDAESVPFVFLFEYRNQFICPFASHFVAETKDPITGPDASTALTINNRDWKIGNNTIYVKCPLLRGGNNAETIDRGTKVIVSYNIRTREWEIIEAQCPAETNSSSNSGSG